jgi:hypothetical protein
MPMSDAETARRLGMKVGEMRERQARLHLESETACRTHGRENESRSGRKFRVAFVADPVRSVDTGLGTRKVHVDPTQLTLDLCAAGKVPNRRAWSWKAARAAIEKAGERAIEELGEPSPKRARSEWLVYESMGGERLATELHGLTYAEAEYVRSKSIGSHPSHHRIVDWPSQSTAPVQCVEHDE